MVVSERKVLSGTTPFRRKANMPPNSNFEDCVFINCPFDPEFDPILQAILFCIVHLGLHPRLSREVDNGAQARLDTIQQLIETSKYSIHDLSRCQARTDGEIFRLNMPFELGVDFGCRRYGTAQQSTKSFLILEEQSHRYLRALSDLGGSDIHYHNGDHRKAVAKVRNWLVQICRLQNVAGPSGILAKYADFQGWHYDYQLAIGFSEADIVEYPTMELLSSMYEWHVLGCPAEYQVC
jgi:hypothetical protein